MTVELNGRSGELLLVSRTWTPLGVRDLYGLSSNPRLGLPQGEFAKCEYRWFNDRALSDDVLGGFDGGCDGTV